VDAVTAVQNSGETATTGVVGRPFPKGVSGNPGGRPKGLARYVRELVGDDGRRIAEFMVGVLDDETERTETRMQAAAWLADRGFGKAPTTVDGGGHGPAEIIVVQSVFEQAAEEFRAEVLRLSADASETA
jgi:Family of unknown function (DUF5681)